MANRLLGVISALPEEFAHLSDQSGSAGEIGGLAFWRGQIAGREAVFVELGAGKVNAGVATSLLLDRFGCRALMLCGVAGGLDPALGVGDVVVGVSHTQHDYGTQREDSFHTIQPGSRPSLGGDWTPGYPLAERAGGAPARGLAGPRARTAARGGRRRPTDAVGAFRHDPDRRQFRQFGAHAAAPARAVQGAGRRDGGRRGGPGRARWGDDIPFVNVRCLSDLAGVESHLDFRAFLPVAARYASQVAHRLAPVI